MRSILGLATHLVMAAFLVCAAAVHAAEIASLAELTVQGRVLVLRHANAPGVGDPDHFAVDDCSTQRNLDAAGREQARALGARFAAAGIRRATIYSSQWCRCLETGRLLGLGPVVALPALNSFFGRPQDRPPRIAALREFLRTLPTDSAPVVLVTHQVTIHALTGRSPGPASGVILQLDATSAPRVLGDIAAW